MYDRLLPNISVSGDAEIGEKMATHVGTARVTENGGRLRRSGIITVNSMCECNSLTV